MQAERDRPSLGLRHPWALGIVAFLWVIGVLLTTRWLLARRAARLRPRLERLRDRLVAGLQRGAWVPPPASSPPRSQPDKEA